MVVIPVVDKLSPFTESQVLHDPSLQLLPPLRLKYRFPRGSIVFIRLLLLLQPTAGVQFGLGSDAPSIIALIRRQQRDMTAWFGVAGRGRWASDDRGGT